MGFKYGIRLHIFLSERAGAFPILIVCEKVVKFKILLLERISIRSSK